ncbi:MAG: PDZ domain-containing protein [Chloroflexi bacterium]|nr:PDZ domain-containing protein [Chloroflexota bacterium]
MNKLASAAVIVVAALGISALVVTQTGLIEAGRQPSPVGSESVNPPNPQEADDADVVEKPFLGISVHDLTEEDKARLGVDVGVLVIDVLDDGPSAGLLQRDDVVLAVAGVNVASTHELTNVVADLVPGEDADLSVIRAGQPVNVTVTVGEHPAAPRKIFKSHIKKLPGGFGPALGMLPQITDKLIRAEVVIETDDGPKTYTALRGTVTRVDIDAGDFDLDPADGSTTTTFTITDETVVSVRRTGDLSGLAVDEQAFVVLVDGEVKMVVQGLQTGKGIGTHSFGLPGFAIPGGGHFGRGGMPQIQQRLRIGSLDSIRDLLDGGSIHDLLESLDVDIESEVLITQ